MRPDRSEEIKELFLEMLSQACGTWNPDSAEMEYDSMCLSAYEDALQLAVELGWIEKGHVKR